jgi:hypothetical protein
MESKPAAAADRERAPNLPLAAWARLRTSQFWMVAIALFLRVSWILVGHTYKFKSAEENFGFGWEMGRIGAAIATGHGFSNALRRAHRANRLGTAALSLPDGCGVSLLRYLFAGVGFRAAQH